VKIFEDLIVLALIASLMIPAALITFMILGAWAAENAF